MSLKVCFAVLAAVCTVRGADTAPEWAQELSSRVLPAQPAEARSVTLLDESHATVHTDGRVTTQFRQAVRIVTVEGRRDAVATVQYLKGNGGVRDFHAWLISPSGFVKAYGKESAVDIALKESFALYEDYRMRYIEARNPEIGSTFAWSAEREEPALVPQTAWYFQGRQPVLVSRYMLTVPPDWKVQATTFNHPPITPALDGNTYTWEARDLPLIKQEPASPKLTSLAPRLGVSYAPATSVSGLQALNTWNDVSSWMARLTDSQAETNEAMAAKVNELTASAPTEYARLQAIGHYVQNIKYVAIEINLARGGGYQPHLSTEVFANQYGDCKDKANLMRAMLKLAGIDSYLVNIYAGDRNHVQSEWPSPHQFNHAIIAIRVTENMRAEPVFVHPVLGRLLLFDPTDASTALGDLPEYEQGSYALIVAGRQGGIIRVPSAAPETNRTDIRVNATLTEDGALEADVSDESRGQSAAGVRRLHSYAQQTDFQREIEMWLSASAKEVTLTKIERKDAFENSRFGLNVSFKAPSYAQVMQRRLMVFRPFIVERWNGFRLQTGARTTPVVLEAECYHKQVHVKLPPDFSPDEMPDPASFTAPFGKYSSTYTMKDGELVFSEELDVTAATIPSERYGEVKDFFEHVVGAEHAPVVLARR
jgi:transglutaminase-like putative cysteine protease